MDAYIDWNAIAAWIEEHLQNASNEQHLLVAVTDSDAVSCFLRVTTRTRRAVSEQIFAKHSVNFMD
jgi:hypothetical protein